MSCVVGLRHGLEFLWLWGRLAAVALIQPLAWEPPYATGSGPRKGKRTKKKKKERKKERKKEQFCQCYLSKGLVVK